MLNRYRTALMEAADPQQSAAPATSTTTQTPAPAAPAAGEEWRNMTAEQFKARLGEATAAGEAKLLKTLGVKEPGEIKNALAEFKKLQDAQLSEQERAKKEIADLAPKAAEAERLGKIVADRAKIEFERLPKVAQDYIAKMAGDDPAARLNAINAAVETGMLAALTPVAAPAALTAPVEKKPSDPATTMAPSGPTPPVPSSNKTAYEKHQDLMKAGKDILAANFYQNNRKAIEASRPQK